MAASSSVAAEATVVETEEAAAGTHVRETAIGRSTAPSLQTQGPALPSASATRANPEEEAARVKRRLALFVVLLASGLGAAHFLLWPDRRSKAGDGQALSPGQDLGRAKVTTSGSPGEASSTSAKGSGAGTTTSGIEGTAARSSAAPVLSPPPAKVSTIVGAQLADAGTGSQIRPLLPPDTTECASDLNCPEHHACLTDHLHNRNSCLPANCGSDTDCPQGQGCRVVNDAAVREAVRRCVIAGSRLEGQSCSRWPNEPISACDEGLVCANGRCGRPCNTAGPNTCPPAFACSATNVGDVCTPDCRQGGCPQGRSCVALTQTMALCLEAASTDCRLPENQCPDGQQCGVTFSSTSVLFYCTRACSVFDTSACEPNETCGSIGGQARCLLRCNPKQRNSCPTNFRCWFADETQTSYACQPLPPVNPRAH
jgi:hypothetical protein